MMTLETKISQLKSELAALEAMSLCERRSAVWKRLDSHAMTREEMQLLREMLDKRIREMYDSDDE